MKHAVLWLALLSGTAAAAPDEAAYGSDDGYPTGDRATIPQQRHMVGAFSVIQSLFPARAVPPAGWLMVLGFVSLVASPAGLGWMRWRRGRPSP